MISTAPGHAYAARSAADAVEDKAQGVVAWFLGWLQQSLCALHGHDAILQYERNRIFLRCTSCGHATPGWEVAHNSTVRHRAVEGRAQLAAPGDLAVVRKIA